MIKQAANLVVLQKYFDQWDYSLKVLGERLLSISLNNWNAEKVKLIIEEDPTPFFYSKIFSDYQVVVEEGLLTPTQRSFQAQQLLDINSAFGREVFPPSFIIKDMNLSGKTEAIEFLKQQEEQASAINQEAATIQHTFEEAKLKEMYARTAAAIATARERHSRSDSNLGLFEERLSEISKNHAIAVKDKMEALEKLVDVVNRFGDLDASLGLMDVDRSRDEEDVRGDLERIDAQRTSTGNRFVAEIMGGLPGLQANQQGGQREDQFG
jgi:hypothetical protein